MMQLNHLNLAVPDVVQASRFFETFFGFRCTEIKGRDTLAVLHGEDGFVLVLSNFAKQETPVYPGAFHLGFLQQSKEQVDALYERFKAAEFDIEPPRNMHGSWAFYLKAPGDVLIEVSCLDARKPSV